MPYSMRTTQLWLAMRLPRIEVTATSCSAARQGVLRLIWISCQKGVPCFAKAAFSCAMCADPKPMTMANVQISSRSPMAASDT